MDINGVIFQIHFAETLKQCGVICIKNKNNCIVKPTVTLNNVCDIQNEFILTNDTIAKFNNENLKYTEMSISSPDAVKLDYFDLIAFFLCKPNPNMKLFDLSVIPTDKDVDIDKDIDRSYLIPNIVFFKDSMEFIDEYIGHLYPNIVKHIDSVLTP